MAQGNHGDGSIQEALRATARRFFDKRLPFERQEYEVAGSVLHHGGVLWDEFVQMGWTGIAFPEALGGAGGEVSLLATLFEEGGRALCPGPFFATMALAAPAIELDPAAAERLSDGSSFTLAWMEPGAEISLADVSRTMCEASPNDGGWSITGVKVRVPEAEPAHEAVVVARASDGVGLYLIDLADEGVTITASHSSDPTRPDHTIELDGVRAARLVTPDQTPAILTLMRRRGLAAASSEAIGIAEAVLAEAVRHASSRHQFGKPIGSFQAVSGPLAESYVDIEMAKALVGWALRCLEEDDAHVDTALAAAKAAAASAAIGTLERAIQVSGAMGFTWEYPLHYFLRRSLWLDAFEGRAARQLAEVASTLLREPVPPLTVELLDDAHAADVRASVRDWIRENLPALAQTGASLSSLETFEDVKTTWRKAMSDTGNLVSHWPEALGGKGSTAVATAIFREEAIRAHPRVSHGDCGADLVAPLLMRYGTEAQKTRFLDGIRTETEIWTQGFSEPNSGSDLASLETRATRRGDCWVLNGTKTWATYSPVADWIFVLARTDPEASRHRGISCFLVDARSPGVSIRPIKDIAGDEEFGEIFFTDVEVPASNILGGVNEGWNIAITTLAHERVIESYEDIGELGFVFERLLEGLRRSQSSDPQRATASPDWNRVAELWCRFQAVRLVQYRCVLALESSEAPPSESEIVKLVWSEVAQDVSRLALDHLGPSTDPESPDSPEAVFWERNYFAARSLTIYAGTSEIIRSVIAERVLGLPRSR